MQIYDVFGRLLGVKKIPDGWQVFRVDQGQGKRSRLHEVVIPGFVTEDEVAGWLDDIFHESASAKYPVVVRVG